jgi:hypothetical protein
VLAFSDEYELSAMAPTDALASGEPIRCNERNKGWYLRLTRLTAAESPKGREIGLGGIGSVWEFDFFSEALKGVFHVQ